MLRKKSLDALERLSKETGKPISEIVAAIRRMPPPTPAEAERIRAAADAADDDGPGER